MGMSADSLHLTYTKPFVLIDPLIIILVWGILLDGPPEIHEEEGHRGRTVPSVPPILSLDFPLQSYFLIGPTFSR